MFLKRVSMCGFKSFADKVDFDFGPGVTCVVGPNGCGKSNVVDAVKWVLGEQSAKSLRGRQMADMIFAGSTTRKSSGMAQVDLVFDNRSGRLAIDQAEVTVTRKLYRSGESEYLLNGGTSRLKDIRELFLDTGVGVEAYSIIEQGKVDGLLQSNPQERRIIFEEAAGISKYKARKKEAERKLERTQQNLLRAADIIEELEKRLRSVKLQAGKARSFKEYEARLHELRLSYSMAEYHRFSEEIRSLTREVDARVDRVTALKTDIDRCEAEESSLALQVDGLSEQINTTESQLVQARADLRSQEERIDAARLRGEEQRVLLTRLHERLSADTVRLQESEAELAAVQETAVKLQHETHELHAEIDRLNEQDRGLARELTEAQATLEDEKTGIIDLVRKSAQTHNEIIRLNTHRENLLGQQGRLATREAEITAELQTQLSRQAQLQAQLAEVEALIEQETRRLAEKKEEAARADSVRQRLIDEQVAAKEQRSALQSRREVLHELQRRMDGIGEGVRSVLEHKRRAEEAGLTTGVLGVIADFFDADVEHARVIEAALGDWDQCVVLRHARTLDEEPGLFADLPGRLSVLSLDRLPPVVNDRDFSGQEGFVARAIDLVRYPQDFDHLARHLFGKTIVTRDRASALRLAREDVHGHRFVTLDGEVVETDGRIVIGPRESGSGLISRRSELRDIDARLVELEGAFVRLADRLNRTQAEVAHLETVQQELRTAIYECNTARVEANAGLNRVRETVDRLTREQPLIAQEAAMISVQIDEVLEKSTAGGKSLESLERENREREARVAEHQRRIDEIVARRTDVQSRLTERRVKAGQLTEKRAAAAETINALRRTMREMENAIAAVQHDIQQGQARIAEADDAVVKGREQLKAIGQRIQSLDIEVNQLRQRRDVLRMEQDRLAQSVRAARGELTAVESELHERQMALAQTNVRRDELAARVSEEMQVNLPERYEQYEHEEQNWAEVEAEIADLRGKMSRLGNVNLDAIQELEELEKRHEFLAAQRDDLSESIRQLNLLIERLNVESRERFTASFEQIRDNFRAMFRKLFGGGRADIVLEDAENPLDCGIEIVAQPPGKDLQIISLMSGGEKSMTAIALLMSIFQSRPAPFAILDEVDAALDEANNDRFNRIVQEFVSQAQFLIITHSKRTMSIGDQLYGITMQEPGVSTRVSVRLTEASAA